MADARFTTTFGADSFGTTFTDDGFNTCFGRITRVQEGVPYEGSYEVTPTRQTQILPTEGKLMSADVIVNPIPPEYGLVEWNGITMRIS